MRFKILSSNLWYQVNIWENESEEKNYSDEELDSEARRFGSYLVESWDFKELQRIIESRNWEKLMGEWIIPDEKIKDLMEEISGIKIRAKNLINRKSKEISPKDLRTIEKGLREIDKVQEYLESQRQIKVASFGAELYRKGLNEVAKLDSWIRNFE
jgi:hypothetical protein